MSKLDQLFTEFYHLGDEERQRFLSTLMEVCGGEPCIVRTRIPVWTLVQSQRLGLSDAEILKCYPTLRAEDLVNAWSYSRRNPEIIDRQILENETA
jgi:uncharacterized protein (DUF433 family)